MIDRKMGIAVSSASSSIASLPTVQPLSSITEANSDGSSSRAHSSDNGTMAPPETCTHLLQKSFFEHTSLSAMSIKLISTQPKAPKPVHNLYTLLNTKSVQNPQRSSYRVLVPESNPLQKALIAPCKAKYSLAETLVRECVKLTKT